MKFEIKETNVLIEAENISIGTNVRFGRDISIKIRGSFSLGDNSIVGDRFKANAEELSIGEYFYNKPTDNRYMDIGGGGSNFPFAKLKIGKRCVCHTGQINLARPISIGDDVGLSHDVDLITHGFWYSVLQGYPATFRGIQLGNNVILGWKTIVMPGVSICDNTVVGANATVTKSIMEEGIYGGTPAKLLRTIIKPTNAEKNEIASNLIKEFQELINYYDTPCTISLEYPNVILNDLTMNLETFSYAGKHDATTDAFRDFLRRYGIRIYAPQGFAFNLKRK